MKTLESDRIHYIEDDFKDVEVIEADEDQDENNEEEEEENEDDPDEEEDDESLVEEGTE